MAGTHPPFYRGRVCLNVLAGSKANAKAIYDACDGHVLIGLLSKNYPDVERAVADMRDYADLLDNAISVGLGAGDPRQSEMVAAIAGQLQPRHVNQVFTGVGASRARLGQRDTFVNGLVAPTDQAGVVRISTGPLSDAAEPANVGIDTAIALIKDMGGDSIKFFPMQGLARRDEYVAIARACARNDFGLEPTGGITPDNFEEIVHIALDAGVPKLIPHVYGAIIDSQSGDTDVAQTGKLHKILKQLID